jgi:hypothetical protein
MAALHEAAHQHVYDALDSAVQHRGNHDLGVCGNRDMQWIQEASAFCAALNSFAKGRERQSDSLLASVSIFSVFKNLRQRKLFEDTYFL